MAPEGGLEFATNFALAANKLRHAYDNGLGVTLTAAEAKAVIDGFNALRAPETIREWADKAEGGEDS